MLYLIDEDLATDIARIGRGLGLDVVSVHENDRESWTDEQQLQQAAIEGRCIVTANRDDFRRLTDAFSLENRPHAGVLVVPETLRRRGATAIAYALVAFNRTRGDFPSEYLWDFLQPAEL
jgi:hypothetical protein